MSAIIYPFPGSIRQPGDQVRRAHERNRDEQKKRQSIQQLRKDLKTPDRHGRKIRRKLRSFENAVRLARRLGNDLAALSQQSRGRLQSILDTAKIHKTNRKRYALFGDDSADDEQRVLKLHGYVRLADAVAAALGRDVDLYLYNLLQDLGILEIEGSPEDDDAADLCFLLEEMTRSVARKTNLLEFFDAANRTLGSVNALGGITRSSMTVLRDRGFEEAFDHWTEPQPIPFVPLFRLLEQRLTATARFGPTILVEAGAVNAFMQHWQEKITDTKQPVIVELWREIGLAVGEHSGRGLIGAMFSGRAHIRVRVGEVAYELMVPWTLEPCYRGLPVFLMNGDGENAFTAVVTIDDENWHPFWLEPAPPPGEPSHAVEHYYFSFHAVTPWTVRRLLDRSEDTFQAVELLLPNQKADEIEYRLGGEIGRAVERALMSGLLENELTDAIDQMKRELERYVGERREVLRAQDETMLNRWLDSKEED
jgi:hypothetical protein